MAELNTTCCTPEAQMTCCEPEDKECCGQGPGCGCGPATVGVTDKHGTEVFGSTL